MTKKILNLIDLDKLYDQSRGAVCVNEIPAGVTDFNDYITKTIFFSMDGQLEFSASCECGQLNGNNYEGVRCPNCGSIVSSEFVDSLTHTNWIGIPEFIMPKVLHPIVFFVLKDFLGKLNGISILERLLNPAVTLPDSIADGIYAVIHGNDKSRYGNKPKGKKIEACQGSKFFYNHYDEILHYFINIYPKTAKLAKQRPIFPMFFQRYKNITWTSKLPILDPKLHPVSKNGVTKISIDKISSYALNAINSLTYSLYEMKKSITSEKFADKVLWKTYTEYIQYTEIIMDKKLGGKFGHLRKQMFGMRAHFSARAVAVPYTRCSMADEIKLPWVIGVHTFKEHLINHMCNRHGYSWSNAILKYERALVNYDEFIHQLLMTILDEHPRDPLPPSVYYNSTYGFPMLVGRNP